MAPNTIIVMSEKMNQIFKYTIFAAICSGFVACSGDDGSDGAQGIQGVQGLQGALGESGNNAILLQTNLPVGNSQCVNGGVQIDSGIDADGNSALSASEITDTSYVCSPSVEKNFNRVSSFLVCSQAEESCNTNTETAAEIVASSKDGLTLIYSDSPSEQIGFVDITSPAAPKGLGTLSLTGEPTSVAVKDGYVLVGVNTSADFINVSGHLDVVNIVTQTIVETIDLGGQPDSVAVSPDGMYAAVVIENERDEDLGDGVPPQAPAGELIIVSLSGTPDAWTTSAVAMTGLADLYAGDPEPEYVDINENNIAVVTLQENNHIILVDLTDGSIVNDFSAGSVDLTMIDTSEEAPALISLTESQDSVFREPDGVTWINNQLFVTADEGDLDGGSRGFTVFNMQGDVVWNSGVSLDHMAVKFGHYPDARSGNKGNEPENAEFGSFAGDDYLFVNSERSSLVFVYNVNDTARPVYKQVLPAAAGPEGVLAIPSRNLLIAASEEDSRGDKMRSVLNIYSYSVASPSYPSIHSANRENGTPIPWSALSGLAAHSTDANILYTVEDSFYQQNRILTLDISKVPAMLTEEIRILDSNDVFASLDVVALADDTVDDDHAARVDVFDEADLALLINDDKSINIDPEGISVSADGGFWVASEGSGTLGDAGRPVNSLNFLFKTDANGIIENVVTLPAEVNSKQVRFGFEGVAEYNGTAYVAFQRVWAGDSNVRIGAYDVANETWSFFFYPLDEVESQNGGWVGLSDITSLGNGQFLVLERDNQGGPDAAIKRIYQIDLNGVNVGNVVAKTLVRDITADLLASGGLIAEKVEGLAVTASGDVYVVNDNDGVDDHSGETQLIHLGDIL